MSEEQTSPLSDQSDDFNELIQDIHRSIDCNVIRQIYGTNQNCIDTNAAFEAILAQKLYDFEREAPQENSAESFAQQETRDYPHQVSIPDNQAQFFDPVSSADTRPVSVEENIETINLDEDSLEANAVTGLTELSHYNANVPQQEEYPRPNMLEVENRQESGNLGHFVETSRTEPSIDWHCYCGRNYCNAFFLTAHKMHIHGEGWNIVPAPKTDHLKRFLVQGSENPPAMPTETNPVSRDDNLSMECKEVTSRFRIWSLEKHTAEFFNSQNLSDDQQGNTSTFNPERRDSGSSEEKFLKVSAPEQLIEPRSENVGTDRFLIPAIPRSPKHNLHKSDSSLARMKSFVDKIRSGIVVDDEKPGPSGYRRPQCDICDKYFIDERRLEKHIVEEHEDEAFLTYMCNKCEKKFDRKEDFKAHNLTHKENKPFKCTVCGKCFATLNQKFNHELEDHNETDESILKGRGSLYEPK